VPSTSQRGSPSSLGSIGGNSSQIIWAIMLSNLGSSTLATSTSPVTVESAPCQRQNAAITRTALPGSAAGTSSGWRHIWFGSTYLVLNRNTTR
jgi:hypothetical protein